MSSLVITEEQLIAAVADRVAAVLTEERLQAIADARIDERIATLTLPEAMRRLGCTTERQLIEACRECQIPISRLSRKRRVIRLAHVEAAIARASAIPEDPEAKTGTKITRLRAA